jgi:hypothetical protein
MYDLQLDVRGSTALEGNFLRISIGEIKSGKGQQDATDQLLKRLVVISLASQVLLRRVPIEKRPQIYCLGEIFAYNDKWISPTSDEIVRSMDTLDLNAGLLGAPIVPIIQIEVARLCQ